MKTSKAKGTGGTKKASVAVEAVKSMKTTPGKSGPGEDEIRAKAREIYQERINNGGNGTALTDWLKAEELLRGSRN